MKNLFRIFMVVALFACYACSQDSTTDLELQEPAITLSAEMPNLADTKTELGEKSSNRYPVYWSEGDQISINGVYSSELTADAAGATRVEFDFVATGLVNPYEASYPATSEAGKVLFAENQTHTEGTFAQGAATMYGVSETASIQMRHLTGILQLPIVSKADETVVLKKVVITSAKPSIKLSGTFDAELVDDEVVIAPEPSAKNRIIYNCNEGLTLSSTEATILHIAVPFGTHGLLSLGLYAEDGSACQLKIQANEDKPIRAGAVREFSNITFENNDSSFIISDSESLMQFASLCEAGNFFPTYTGARVVADIDFDTDTYTWKPITGFTFGGRFDGGDFTISGLTAPMFDHAIAHIHNVKLNSTIEAAAADEDGIGLLANVFEGSVVSCVTSGALTITGSTDSGRVAFGGVIGEVSGSTAFDDVTNHASVSVNSAEAAYIGIAGILGGTYVAYYLGEGSYVSFNNCHNTGAMTSGASGANRRAIAGIIGYSYGYHSLTLTGCSNTGAMLNQTIVTDLHMGGMVGTSSGDAVITSCWNSGTVTCEGDQTATGNNYSLGGIVGYGSTVKLHVFDCENKAEGTITLGNVGTGGPALGGIIGNAAIDSKIKGCKNYGAVNLNGTAANGNQSARAAGIVGRTNGGGTTISNCHNYGNITRGAAEGAGKFDFGGIAGRIQGGEVADTYLIENCTNSGIIKYLGTSNDNELNFGGILGTDGIGVTVQGCDNLEAAQVVINGNTTSASCPGGIVGNVSASKGTVKDCENWGTIKQGSGQTANLYMGGIVGYGYAFGLIDGCKNHGQIEITPYTEDSYGVNAKTYRVGGVIGYPRDQAAVGTHSVVSNCTNEADLTFTGVAGGTLSAGGVIGFAGWGGSKASMEFKDLTNNGDITFNMTATNAHWLGGVAGLLHGGNITNIHNTGNVTYTGTITTGTETSANTIDGEVCAIGGAVGYLGYVNDEVLFTAKNITNSGDVTITPQDGAKTDGMAHGGVIGLAYNILVDGAHFKKATGATEAPKIQYTGYKFNHIPKLNDKGEDKGTNSLMSTGCVVGSALATVSGANIENCINDGDIYLNSSDAQGSHNTSTGGIVGWVRLGSYGSIINCTNNGDYICGADHDGKNKSMNHGGIAGNPNCAITDCKTTGDIIFKTRNVTVTTGNTFYSTLVGGIVGNSSGGVVKGCTMSGQMIAESNSLNPRASSVYHTFGGIIGNTAAASAWAAEECTFSGTISVNAASAVADKRFWVAGIVARPLYKTTLAYLAKNCTVTGTISATANTQVGLVCGETYATAATKYTPTDETTQFPAMNNSIAGSIATSDVAATTITASNFYKYIYQDTPSVDTWTASATKYHGNYFGQ